MNEIESIAKECLTINPNRNSIYELSSKIIEFSYELENNDFLNESLSAEDIIHCEKIPIKLKGLELRLNDAAKIVARVFETKSSFLTNHLNKGSSIIFSGMPNNVKASAVVFRRFQSLFVDTRRQYIKSLSSRTKPANKKIKAEEYMMEWVDEISEAVSCDPISPRDEKVLNKYIKRKFITNEDLENCNRFSVDLINMILEFPERTIGETKSILFKRYGKNAFDKYIKLLERSKNEDIVMIFRAFS